MVFEIDGKVAVVTGGASGLGYRFSQELLKNGIKGITIADFDDKNGIKVTEEFNETFGSGKAIFVKTDVSQKDQFEKAFQETVETFKHVDILINCAGIMNDAIYEKEIDVNVKGVAHGTILGIDNYIRYNKIADEGVIINIASVAGLRGYGYMPVYVGSKFAVIGMSLGFSTPHHYNRTKVRIAALCPGASATPLLNVKGKFISSEYEESIPEAKDLHQVQGVDIIAEELIKIIKYAKNSTVWVVEYDKPAYEYKLIDRQTLTDNVLKQDS